MFKRVVFGSFMAAMLCGLNSYAGATEGLVDEAMLQAMGLSGMVVMTDEEALDVRGYGFEMYGQPSYDRDRHGRGNKGSGKNHHKKNSGKKNHKGKSKSNAQVGGFSFASVSSKKHQASSKAGYHAKGKKLAKGESSSWARIGKKGRGGGGKKAGGRKRGGGKGMGNRGRGNNGRGNKGGGKRGGKNGGVTAFAAGYSWAKAK